MITVWKLAPALAAGNVLIIKSSELSPLYAQRLAELVREAGIPAGVVNVMTGEGSTAGQALSEHMDVRKIAFTGSAMAGRKVLQAASRSNLKKVSLELGGKGPSIVFDDCDLDNALLWTRIGITANNGQICAAGSRIYVQEPIYEHFLEAYKKAAAAAPTVAGDPLDASTTKGPIVSQAQHQKILNYIQQGKESGARLLFGGERIGDVGYFVQNTAFADVADDATIMREEIFGPVAVSENSLLLLWAFKACPTEVPRLTEHRQIFHRGGSSRQSQRLPSWPQRRHFHQRRQSCLSRHQSPRIRSSHCKCLGNVESQCAVRRCQGEWIWTRHGRRSVGRVDNGEGRQVPHPSKTLKARLIAYVNFLPSLSWSRENWLRTVRHFTRLLYLKL